MSLTVKDGQIPLIKLDRGIVAGYLMSMVLFTAAINILVSSAEKRMKRASYEF